MTRKNQRRLNGTSEALSEITIDSLAFGGEGVGRTAENMAVFIEGAVPGDRLKIRLGKNKRNLQSAISKKLLLRRRSALNRAANISAAA